MVKGIQRDSKGIDRITFDGLLGHLVAVPPNSILSAPPPNFMRNETSRSFMTGRRKSYETTLDFSLIWAQNRSKLQKKHGFCPEFHF